MKVPIETHTRLKSLQKSARKQGLRLSLTSIMAMAVNELPLKFFKLINK